MTIDRKAMYVKPLDNTTDNLYPYEFGLVRAVDTATSNAMYLRPRDAVVNSPGKDGFGTYVWKKYRTTTSAFDNLPRAIWYPSSSSWGCINTGGTINPATNTVAFNPISQDDTGTFAVTSRLLDNSSKGIVYARKSDDINYYYTRSTSDYYVYPSIDIHCFAIVSVKSDTNNEAQNAASFKWMVHTDMGNSTLVTSGKRLLSSTKVGSYWFATYYLYTTGTESSDNLDLIEICGLARGTLGSSNIFSVPLLCVGSSLTSSDYTVGIHEIGYEMRVCEGL